ncbi:MAG: hypothetical protein H7839_05060 [Magnetococcus sp. YQC-5]
MNHAQMEEKIRSIIYTGIDAINEELPVSSHISKNDETVLVGSNGAIDSLHLINLLIYVDDMVAEQLNVSLSLMNELENMLVENGPLSSISQFVSYIIRLIGD